MHHEVIRIYCLMPLVSCVGRPDLKALSLKQGQLIFIIIFFLVFSPLFFFLKTTPPHVIGQLDKLLREVSQCVMHNIVCTANIK